MHDGLGIPVIEDMMDPFNLLRLADDTLILADKLESFKNKMNKVISYSEDKLLKINIKKTKYLHICKNQR